MNRPLPESFAAMIRLYQNPEGDEANPYKIEFRHASGPSAAKLLGRFCHSDQVLEEKVRALILQEESLHPDKIFAEIAHVPQARIGNVLSRPHLRKYEICFLAKSTINPKYQISIDDLYLKLEAGRLVLFSKKLKKEIVPRLTSAHNYSQNNLQIYHFLCDLQMQNVLGAMAWSWDFLSGMDFLPRVIYHPCRYATKMHSVRKYLRCNVKQLAFELYSHVRKSPNAF